MNIKRIWEDRKISQKKLGELVGKSESNYLRLQAKLEESSLESQ